MSPDGQYYLVARSYTLRNFRFFAVPGDGGGHYDDGVIELYTINGKSLGSKYTQTMELINQTAWNKDEVHVKLVGEWTLPVTLSQSLIDERARLNGINFDDAESSCAPRLRLRTCERTLTKRFHSYSYFEKKSRA